MVQDQAHLCEIFIYLFWYCHCPKLLSFEYTSLEEYTSSIISSPDSQILKHEEVGMIS